jgi:[acyl-carrier-protein] S-malonyltransferase
MLQPAAEGLAKAICSMPFNTPAIPVVANASALPLVSVDGIKDELEQQLTHAVQWQKSIEYMIAQDIDTFIEIGPGKVLSGLIKRISKGIKTLNIGDAQSINGILTEGLTL